MLPIARLTIDIQISTLVIRTTGHKIEEILLQIGKQIIGINKIIFTTPITDDFSEIPIETITGFTLHKPLNKNIFLKKTRSIPITNLSHKSKCQ